MRLVSPKLVENCKCEPVILSEIDEIMKTADKMFELMTAKNGIGLAAPQIGIFKRFFIIKNFSSPGYQLFINPVISWKSEKTGKFKEGCMTYSTPGNKPEWWVRRPKSIMASWWLSDGSGMRKKMSRLTAQVFQHEFQHLDGITIKTNHS